ncbi:MAG: HlyD family efflux transporter periplasmic adaptor subunit [Rudaea sp.]|uniref:HlyD family secretion protein n=1 Tax=Rudaea sp. TaxID=2136325 RepID=UPI0039E30AFE
MENVGRRLFRQEVIAAKRCDWLGTIELAMPLPYRLLTAISIIVCLALGAFLTLGSYTRHQSVSGELTPSQGLLTTAAPTAGTIARVWVHEGDTVARDQALVEISTDIDNPVIGKTRNAISQEIKAQRSHYVQALQDQVRLTVQKEQGFASRIASLRDQRHQLDAQLTIQFKQAQSAQALWEKLQPLLSSGIVSGVQIEQQKSAALAAQAECAALRRQRAEIQQQLATQQDQLNQMPLNAETERIELQHKIAELDQALAQNESQRAVVLRAAQAGVVSSLAVMGGQSVIAGQRLLSLVPEGSQLQAELWLPSHAIGFVATGDYVLLRYQAFPYQKFGHQIGNVAEVSRSATGANELTTLLGHKVEEPMYRVTVRLQQQSIFAYDKLENLKPGMTLDADILLDRRRLIEWLLEPVFGFARNAAVPT